MWSVWVIILILSFQVYNAYSQSITDTDSYVSAIQQEVFLNNELVIDDWRLLLSAWDTIRTSSTWRAIIEWWDGSITRIWEWSEIYIEEAQVNANRTQINISFELFSWRTWSNVVSFLGNDSSFTQKIEWLDAWVRWTVFDVDLEAWFIRVSEHIVELSNNQWESIILTSDTPFDIVRWAFIDIDVFLRSFQDATWTEFNRISDREFRTQMLLDLETSIEQNNPLLKIMEWLFPHYRILYELDNSESFERTEGLISNLSQNGRRKTKELIQSRYQDFNFVSPSEENLYARKIRYQKALLLLSDDQVFQRSVLERSLLDLQASVSSWNTSEVEVITSLLESHWDIVPNIDVGVLDSVLWWLWDELWNELERTRSVLEDIFQIDFSQISIGGAEHILDGASGTIEEFLEDNFGNTIRNFLR